MTATTEFDLIKIKNEFLNKLRYRLNQYDNKSRVTEKTKTFTGDGSTTIFALSSKMSYVKSVTVDSTELEFGKEYEIVWRGSNKGSVELTTAPNDSSSISVVYGEKDTGNFVYSDFPRTDLSTESYPRIGFKMYFNSEIAGAGGGCDIPFKHEGLIQVKIVDVDVYNIDYLVGRIEQFIKSNTKGFYYINYIEPQTINNYQNYDDNSNFAKARIIEFKIPNKIEIVTQE